MAIVEAEGYIFDYLVFKILISNEEEITVDSRISRFVNLLLVTLSTLF